MTTDIRPLGETDGMDFCRRLPDRAGVVAIPSSVFYDNEAAGRSQVRFAFCKQDEVLREAVARLARHRGERGAGRRVRGGAVRRAGRGGNLVFSPGSIATALRMTLLGARGETAAQLAAVLHLAKPQDAAAGLLDTCARLRPRPGRRRAHAARAEHHVGAVRAAGAAGLHRGAGPGGVRPAPGGRLRPAAAARPGSRSTT